MAKQIYDIRRIPSNEEVLVIMGNEFLTDPLKDELYKLQKHDVDLGTIIEASLNTFEKYVNDGEISFDVKPMVTRIDIILPHIIEAETDDITTIPNLIKEHFDNRTFDYDVGESYIIKLSVESDKIKKFNYGLVSPADNDGTHPSEMEIYYVEK